MASFQRCCMDLVFFMEDQVMPFMELILLNALESGPVSMTIRGEIGVIMVLGMILLII